jgi:hypothetical protein
MTTNVIDEGVRLYMAGVADELDDLPESERRELLEDLEQHLMEVAAEADGDLVERLGPPEIYAAELRASAGIQPRGEPPERSLRRRLADRLARSGPGRLVRSVAATEAARSVRGFLPELRPGWWVLRGYLAVVIAAVLWEDRAYPFARVLVPRVYGPLIGLVLVGLAIWFSVRLGRRAALSRSARRMSVVSSLGVILLGLMALGQVDRGVVPIEALSVESPSPGYLQHADGAPIANICPFAADGTPLSGVLLFDQSGRPIEDLAPVEEVYGVPGDAEETDTGIAAVANQFPRPQRILDPKTGSVIDFRCPTTASGG